MKINNLDNPIFIFSLCIFAVSVNILSSTHFFPLLFLGLLFMAFFVSLKRKFYYSTMLVILTFCLIEINNGFKIFSLTLLSSFLYIFIAPYIRRVLTFSSLNAYIYMAVFYLGIYIMWSFNNDVTAQLNYTLLINLIIDFVIFGLFI